MISPTIGFGPCSSSINSVHRSPCDPIVSAAACRHRLRHHAKPLPPPVMSSLPPSLPAMVSPSLGQVVSCRVRARHYACRAVLARWAGVSIQARYTWLGCVVACPAGTAHLNTSKVGSSFGSRSCRSGEHIQLYDCLARPMFFHKYFKKSPFCNIFFKITLLSIHVLMKF